MTSTFFSPFLTRHCSLEVFVWIALLISYLPVKGVLAQESPPENRGLKFIDTSFENASPVYYELTDQGTAIYLMYDHERDSLNRAAGHVHLRLETTPGTILRLEFRNLDNIYNGRASLVSKEMHHLVVSHDGKSWRSIASEVAENRVRIVVESPGTQLYLARVEPYRLSDLANLLEAIRTNRDVSIEAIGKTVEGRELEIIQLGDRDAPHHVFLRARAHAWEAGGNWIVEGLIRRSLGEDEQAQRFRKNCCLWIMPMANKDAVARGRTRFNLLGKDLNRDWETPADPDTAPENHALETWLTRRLNSGQRLDFALEIHNDGNGRLHLNSPPAIDRQRYLARLSRFEQLLRTHTWFSVGATQAMHGTGTLPNGWQNRFGIDGAVHEFNCHWIESLEEPPLGHHWLAYGAGLVQVFQDFFSSNPKP